MHHQAKAYIYAVRHEFSAGWSFQILGFADAHKYAAVGSVWIPLGERTLDFEFSPETSVPLTNVIAGLREKQAALAESNRLAHEKIERFIQDLTNASPS